MADKIPAWAKKSQSCVCGHVHHPKNPEIVLEPGRSGSDIIMNKHCWAYFVGGRCECDSFRPPVDPNYRHASSNKKKTTNRAPGENDSRHKPNTIYVPMKLSISDAMLADPEFGTHQTMTLQQYRRLYPENAA